jgi:AAA+ superfamily predicted ATPase
MSDPLFDSLFAALEANASNVALRNQVARLLLDRGRADEAVTQAATVLSHDPGNADALATLTEATTSLRKDALPGNGSHRVHTPQADAERGDAERSDAERGDAEPGDAESRADVPVVDKPSVDSVAQAGDTASAVDAPDTPPAFDWHRAETELGDIAVPPPYVAGAGDEPLKIPLGPGDDTAVAVVDEYGVRVTLADVGGLEDVKTRLRESFLEPMRHPELAKAFGKTLRGGLVLYGPPGCGKTFMARAIAGELGARFLTTNLSDILGSHFGETEKNLHALFEHARSLTPAVLFLDEIDAIGAKRSSIGTGWSGMRAMVDQLLMELDSMEADNDGLFVLAATNSPWEVDPALLRPGRFDRMLLVLPPDEPARDAILRMHLDRRPVAGIDVGELVGNTAGFSGADLEHLVASAAEQAMMNSIKSGRVEPIGMPELRHVLREIRPSTGAWMAGAKNVVAFANSDGRYDDLAEYLASHGPR